MMGGALGLAVLASLADGETRQAIAAGAEPITALAAGHRLAFVWGTGFALLAALTGGLLLRPKMAPLPEGAAAGLVH